ncbi:hypothetical protein [Paraburkholderia caballeronis]|uniref:Uncharacterized protein n=1 Tax=Paraburkholderia caballeronis TaxID=416943 RepID=A0A1H7LI65_9BURK|nr:hypothetical protein [Paraburkholderia caballeronis]PXW28469.1 hypothetical protein C7403_102363 [Paraburkholderia caballeronis]PXX03835.1 hypothetical protein C7407_102363 [Paraburkholderia caballeronis]RAK04579.1 hypothetical protein C7409_102363 [Paraburkholderia caballeronis]TDV19482.1 hypothetical protein C7408_102227 [Paraburkholderia caballeronis]TDV22082.1 hypothetical protein C7406_101227 [Paraburkholderia caballeronis]
MSILASLSRRVVARPLAFLHPRTQAAGAGGSASDERGSQDAQRAARDQDGESRTEAQAERLERIAVYARAGYFNMGYTFDMFPFVGDLPPE